MIWVFVAEITDEFILGLHVLRRVGGLGAQYATTTRIRSIVVETRIMAKSTLAYSGQQLGDYG
jgi:hypothetical protein